MTELPLLSLLLSSPLLGVLLIWLLPDNGNARRIALSVSLLTLGVSLQLLAGFDSSNPDYQFVEKAAWIPSLNIHYLVGIDGISLLFLPLTALLFAGVILASWNSVRQMQRLYLSLLLLLETAILGIFCAMDTLLFFLFWELTLIPFYFLISLWGVGPNRRFAAVKYTLYMLAGGVPLLFGFLLLAFNYAEANGAGLSFDYRSLLASPLPADAQLLVFLLLALGFLVKTPVVPLHTWLPSVTMEGPIVVAALMTGLKLGAYGLIRFAVPLAPAAAQEYHWLLAGLGTVGILYGALMALAQSNLRRMLAYASLSHVGLVVLAIASYNLQGIQGALFQLLNFTLVAGGILLLTSFLHRRTGSTELLSLGGGARSMPLLASFFLIFSLAGLGIPGTSGFPAEFLMLLSILQTHTGAALAALATLVIGAAYVMVSYQRAFFGPMRNDVITNAIDLKIRELLVIVVFTGLILAAGLYPSAILDLTAASTEAWVQHLLPGEQTP